MIGGIGNIGNLSQIQKKRSPREENQLGKILDRQRDLSLRRFNRVLVIGAGGIGFWVVVFLAMSRQVDEIVVVDPDVVEDANLNRLFLPREYIGVPKAVAVKDFVETVMEGTVKPRIVAKVAVFDEGWDITGFDVVVECTDSIDVQRALHDMSARYGVPVVAVHYDGVRDIAIEIGKTRPVDGTGYVTTPSFVAPATLAASLAVYVILSGDVPLDGRYIRLVLPNHYVFSTILR